MDMVNILVFHMNWVQAKNFENKISNRAWRIPGSSDGWSISTSGENLEFKRIFKFGILLLHEAERNQIWRQ